MSSLYLDESLPDSSWEPGYSVTMSGDEAHHAVSVSRLKVGERVFIGNGCGTNAEATVTAVSKKSFTAELNIIDRRAAPSQEVALVQSLAKGDRDERAIEAATEAGVDAIYPYQAARSVARWQGEKLEKGRARWQKVVREASKQSLRYFVPEVREPLSLASLQALATNALLLVLEPGAEVRLSALSSEKLQTAQSVVILVGPEGGFEPNELELLVEAGAQLVKLGDTVLRTSTAGVAALSLLNAKLDRW